MVERYETKAVVKLLVKYPLGTGYPLVMKTVADMYKSVSQQGEVVSFTCDATGVGTVPASMLQEVLPDVRIEAYIFTNQRKRELVGKVKVMHSFGRLKFAVRRGEEVYNRTLHELITEMKQVQAKVIREDSNNPEIEIFKTGQHDDLFTALALAVKDIRFEEGWNELVGFIEDKTWAKSPLTSNPPPEVLFF